MASSRPVAPFAAAPGRGLPPIEPPKLIVG